MKALKTLIALRWAPPITTMTTGRSVPVSPSMTASTSAKPFYTIPDGPFLAGRFGTTYAFNKEDASVDVGVSYMYRPEREN